MLLMKIIPSVALAVLLIGSNPSTQGQQADLSRQIPLVDGAAGPCSIEFTIKNEKGNPIYAAKVAVRLAFGFTGMKKLDLEVGTNVDGKAKFVGLPSKVKSGTMFFRAYSGDLTAVYTHNPTESCTAQKTLVLTPQQ